MIQAWALEQDEASRWDFSKTKAAATVSAVSGPESEEAKTSTAQQDVLVPWKLLPRFFMNQSTSNDDTPTLPEEDEIDCEHVIRQDDGSLLFQRYCHVYRKGELDDLCTR